MDRFINRKGYNSLNVLVIGGFDKMIYDLMPNVPGSMHDAMAYSLSEFKPYLESQFPRELCLGDSAFLISGGFVGALPQGGRGGQEQGSFQYSSLGCKGPND